MTGKASPFGEIGSRPSPSLVASLKDFGFRYGETGGGCSEYDRALVGEDGEQIGYVSIQRRDEPTAPDELDEPVAVRIYLDPGEAHRALIPFESAGALLHALEESGGVVLHPYAQSPDLYRFAVEPYEWDGEGEIPDDAPELGDPEVLILDPALSICGRFIVDPLTEHGARFLASPFATPWHHREAARRAAATPDPDLVSKAVNSFGEGSHPVATPANLSHFTAPYLAECLSRAVAVTDDPDLKARAQAALDYYAAKAIETAEPSEGDEPPATEPEPARCPCCGQTIEASEVKP